MADFLTGIRQSVDEYFKYNEVASQTHKEYIITVPAIWDHLEQDKMRECAERAGMGEGPQLQIISEPEAAGIYAIETRFRTGMEAGDTFVVCDAGGGYVDPSAGSCLWSNSLADMRRTVDLASCSVRSKNPHIQLAITQTNSGGLCGSSYLNRIFETYLERKLKGYKGPWDEDSLNDALKAFESTVKRCFSKMSLDDDHRIRISGLKPSERHGVLKNFLTFTTKELRKEVFDVVIDKIQDLVRKQVANTRGRVKAVLLVGGFGQNPYLREAIQDIDIVKRRNITVERIENRQVQPNDGMTNCTGPTW